MTNEAFEKILRGMESEVSWFKREAERHAFTASETALAVERIAQLVEQERDQNIAAKLKEWADRIRKVLNEPSEDSHL